MRAIHSRGDKGERILRNWRVVGFHNEISQMSFSVARLENRVREGMGNP